MDRSGLIKSAMVSIALVCIDAPQADAVEFVEGSNSAV
jgi:hypothetical protein